MSLFKTAIINGEQRTLPIGNLPRYIDQLFDAFNDVDDTDTIEIFMFGYLCAFYNAYSH